MDSEKVIEIDIKKCLRALKKSIKFIILITLIFLLIGILSAFFIIEQENQYTSTATVYNTSYTNGSNSDNLKQMRHYAEIIKSRTVAERAAEILAEDHISQQDILDMISVNYDSTNSNVSVIHILADSYDQNLSIKVANAVSDSFVLKIADLTGTDNIQTLDKATEAKISYNASSKRISTIFLLTFVGAFLSSLFIVVREILSPKMYSAKDATAYGTLDIIGVIPEFNSRKEL